MSHSALEDFYNHLVSQPSRLITALLPLMIKDEHISKLLYQAAMFKYSFQLRQEQSHTHTQKESGDEPQSQDTSCPNRKAKSMLTLNV